ncbi:S-adenosylmethionine-diacylgycerolhomoserine-N-methyltransferase [Rhizomicrobium palustre]|uniref:S-adenosylmethionine-diacylgycerolhomoserine-N-methyltransferase n=1 Tax=Rhizomicrobium palustre TaxID=189966 RepID=A0A846MY47_9PROT|nr:class I SAM-dependent methyltransferase [Rhizomicrobium palustre]NIK87897.1 S-adenosylmethionine-diacylgycerolhomoserine-N-methyltransferase [Rhizomicrobium palustre]
MSEKAEQETAGGHAELMDRIYRHQRYIYDLTRKYYLFGRDKLIAEMRLGPKARVVEIGCGTARNLVRIARRYPDAELFGLDASQEMLKSAEETIRRAGLSRRITLAHGYAEHLSPAMFSQSEGFDACLFSYSLSMIPDWKASIRAAEANLKPGGKIHAVDFADLTGLGRLGQAAMLFWLRLFHVAPRVELLQALQDQEGANFRLLPGRYAFLLSAERLKI